MKVVFIKPRINDIHDPLKNGSFSVNIGKSFGKDLNWHLVLKTNSEEKKSRKVAKKRIQPLNNHA